MIYYMTDRLILRNFKENDCADYYDYMRLESTARYEDFAPYSLAECEEAVRSRLRDDSFWAVELKENGRMIGDICYREGAYGTYEIAFDFHEKYCRKGYATEACKALIAHIFTALNGRRISAGCNDDNEASRRLLERLGMRREAHCIADVSLKNDGDGNPIYVNSYYYALLKSEWIRQNEANAEKADPI